VRRRGISCEIVPGIMPVTNFRTMVGFAAKAGASVPRWLGQRFEGLDDDPETRRLVAATTVAEQVQGLAEQGVREFHFYTLNRADLSFAICHILGIRPKKPAAVEASP
jgi:methylenetetrahydrofolate reductase (NADPH)